MLKTNDTLKYDPVLSKFIRSYKNRFGRNERIYHIHNGAFEMFYEPHIVFKHKDMDDYLILVLAVNSTTLVFHRYVDEHILKTYGITYLQNGIFDDLLTYVYQFISQYEDGLIDDGFRYKLFNNTIKAK